MKYRYFFFTLLFGFMVSVTLGIGLSINSEDDPILLHDKYTQFKGGTTFVGHAYDLSGVGKGTEPTVQSAFTDTGTMITGSFCLAANHNTRHPQGIGSAEYPNGEILRFFFDGTLDETNPANYEERTVAETWHLGTIHGLSGTNDVQICRLGNEDENGEIVSNPVSGAIAIYPILFLQNLNDYDDLEALCIGKTHVRHYDFDQNAWLGLRACYRRINYAEPVLRRIQFAWNAIPEDYGQATSSDSGSPSFVVDHSFAWGQTWGPLFIGNHWWPLRDSCITKNDERTTLISEIRSKQSNVPLADQEVPIFCTHVFCDFNGDFQLDAADLDIILRESRFHGTRGYNWYLDPNKDGQISDTANTMLAIMGKVRGDANLDGIVGIDDYDIYIANQFQTDKGWGDADFNGDGNVDGSDFNWILANWNE